MHIIIELLTHSIKRLYRPTKFLLRRVCLESRGRQKEYKSAHSVTEALKQTYILQETS